MPIDARDVRNSALADIGAGLVAHIRFRWKADVPRRVLSLPNADKFLDQHGAGSVAEIPLFVPDSAYTTYNLDFEGSPHWFGLLPPNDLTSGSIKVSTGLPHAFDRSSIFENGGGPLQGAALLKPAILKIREPLANQVLLRPEGHPLDGEGLAYLRVGRCQNGCNDLPHANSVETS